MRAILAGLGAAVSLAGTIDEAAALAAGRPFALALIDVNLPDGDGRELARRLCELQPELRVFAATGGGAEASAAIAEGLFAGLLQKPIDPARARPAPQRDPGAGRARLAGRLRGVWVRRSARASPGRSGAGRRRSRG